ncbi:uncharacterized protein LOC123550875 [Mercenaria mercenaria]|uniref:uncharacterized protein LOC123550875 n=1 Tax=Mercenaria mercenaria TaxID=6596 RepID=UPI00234E45CD|nr:uncharacterized protein LOC123550875 [Mercenaria mercenaria]XP_045195273.2 uncharacterized protein LOC123550875 [Mercenaria mercenaria]XP_053396212.1 uncharacterized protein LOC123550875 [Mercenaria mercenaria]
MEKQKDTFFAQLIDLAAKIDRDCEQYKHAISGQNEDFSAPQAIKDISDLKNDVKKLKAPLLTELDRQKKDVQSLNDIASSVDSLLKNFVSPKVSEIEEYMSQYGYKPKGEMCDKENKQEEAYSESEDNDEEMTAPETPPGNVKPPIDPNRTPRLEDAGISQDTLQYLNSLQKNKHHTSTAMPAVQKPVWSDVPSDFLHNGIICTPSLAKSLNADISYSTDLHSALASPVLFSAAKPMPAIEENLPDPSERLLFNTNQKDSPATPVFRTPGIKQILTNTSGKEHESSKFHSSKRPVNVGLFKSDEKETWKPGFKEEVDVPDPMACINDGEPVEPELTYSLEALADMTGVFKIHPVRKSPTHAIHVKPFTAHADVVIDNKENATPPEPEMLIDRISKVNIRQESQLAKDFVPKHTAVNEMPPSPKLFGSYDFL